MRKSPPVQVTVYFPKTDEGRSELARKAASAHAGAVHSQLRRLNCPAGQKRLLLDAVIEAVSGKQTGVRTK